MFCDPKKIWGDLSVSLKPPVEMSVSEAAEKYLKIVVDGRDMGFWSPEYAPHLIEPMNMLESRDYDTVCVVGPARGGKTQALVDAWVLYSVLIDPGDMAIVATSRDEARDFSGSRIAAVHEECPEVAALLSSKATDTTTWDIHYRHGTILRLLYPTKTQLRGKTIRRMALPDYDGMPQGVKTEGSPYQLARKRTETYRSAGKTMVESSPGYPVTSAGWTPATTHEAPPATGIISIYNTGTRARRYWGCDCGEWFEPSFSLLHIHGTPVGDITGDDVDYDAIDDVAMVCPTCGQMYNETDGRRLNINGLWVHDGQKIINGVITGVRRKTNVISYWFKGPVSSASNWSKMVRTYFQALDRYNKSGEEESLISTTQQDQGEPYCPRAFLRSKINSELTSRLEDSMRGEVPDGVRYLIVTVDVQSNRFPIAVWGIGVGNETWLIERLDLYSSERNTRTGEKEPLDPATRQEDWDVLTSYIDRGWALADGSGWLLKPRLLVCDSGGRAGVTPRAYGWWRSLRKTNRHHLVLLVRGDPSMALDAKQYLHRDNDDDVLKKIPRVKLSYPDSTHRSDRHSTARGDVPVLQIYSDAVKDAISADLARDDPGPGYIHLGTWISEDILSELSSETRTIKGWRKTPGTKNETWDLLAYSRAASIHLGCENIKWDSPPIWARPFDTNSFIIKPEIIQKQIIETNIEINKITGKPRGGYITKRRS